MDPCSEYPWSTGELLSFYENWPTYINTVSSLRSPQFKFKADEQRYDACYKVDKAKKETDELRNKHKELKCKIFEASQVTLHQNDPIYITRGCSNVTMVLKVDGFWVDGHPKVGGLERIWAFFRQSGEILSKSCLVLIFRTIQFSLFRIHDLPLFKNV